MSETCPDCRGDCEIYRGPITPDDEGYEPCILCDGHGTLPTVDDIRQMQARLRELEGTDQAFDMVMQDYKTLRQQLATVTAQKDVLGNYVAQLVLQLRGAADHMDTEGGVDDEAIQLIRQLCDEADRYLNGEAQEQDDG